MVDDLTSFLRQHQSGVHVAVASQLPDKLLGVREAFQRYFDAGLGRALPVAIAPHAPKDDPSTELPLTDDAILTLARRRARALQQRDGDRHTFYVGSEAGLLAFDADDQHRYFIRSWTVLLGLGNEAWGSSGSVELPGHVIHGLDEHEIPLAVPATRRHGGMVGSLTGGLEDRRAATALATVHALSTLFYRRGETRSQRSSLGLK